MKIQKKHTYITGSNRGIGWALALQAAQMHAHLHLINRSPLSKDKIDELKAAGAESVQSYSLDLLDRKAISSFLVSIKTHPIDVFINNAGLLTGGLLESQTTDEIYNMLQVNLGALIQITRGILPQMLKQKSGYIVNNSSVSGKMFFPCANTYAASKAGVVGFTESLEAELKGTGVKTLLLITPGVKTDMYDNIADKYGKNLDLGFMNSIPASKWAERVFQHIEENQSVCWPTGSTRAGVWLGHHMPRFFKSLTSSKFSR